MYAPKHRPTTSNVHITKYRLAISFLFRGSVVVKIWDDTITCVVTQKK